MTKYNELIALFQGFMDRVDAFQQRGKDAVATVFEEFARFLEVPVGVCKVGPPGIPLDNDTQYPRFDFAKLRPDGYFAGSMILRDKAQMPMGVILRLTLYVRLEEESGYTLAWGDEGPHSPTHVATLDTSGLRPFFGRLLEHITEQAKLPPERLFASSAPRAIGFTAVF